ncbi:MAG: non-ribosomal peptide synthetase, partial [bacterium]|nr:non-ribosomal peptide synthetase [bacterium]
YLNRVQLTRQRFVSNPHKSGEVLYKSGDLGRRLPGGSVEFLGRNDGQVQVRGFRIEPAEIEYPLLKHPAVAEAVVSVFIEKDRETSLCAYLRLIKGQETPSMPQIREFLSGALPSYMIPSYVVPLRTIPLTPNGKVDKNALPDPRTRQSELKPIPPRNPVEEKLLDIWSEILDTEPGHIGIETNFFDLGGHSLKATRMVSRILETFQIEVPLVEIFLNPTISSVASLISTAESTGDRTGTGGRSDDIQPVEQRDYYDLSFAQRRLWVLCQFSADSTAYNMPSALELFHDFNPDIFQRAIRALIHRHESLRTVFITVDGEPRQKILPHVHADLIHSDLRALSEAEKEKQARNLYLEDANHLFDLEKGPLFLFRLIRLEEKKYLLSHNIHHIVNDGWSKEVINNDVLTLYNAFLEHTDHPLPPL